MPVWVLPPGCCFFFGNWCDKHKGRFEGSGPFRFVLSICQYRFPVNTHP